MLRDFAMSGRGASVQALSTTAPLIKHVLQIKRPLSPRVETSESACSCTASTLHLTTNPERLCHIRINGSEVTRLEVHDAGPQPRPEIPVEQRCSYRVSMRTPEISHVPVTSKMLRDRIEVLEPQKGLYRCCPSSPQCI